MPVATTTEAGRQVLTPAAEKILNDRERRRLASDRAAAALNAPQDAPLFDAAPQAPPARPLATFTIHALMDDFPFEVSFSGTADQLAATVQRLRDLGAVPPTQAARAAVEAEKERSAPVCEFHGPMKESSKRPGTFYCPAKMGDNSYCKSKG